MSVTTQQLNQALETIEQQLKIIKQALVEKGLAQDEGVIGIFDGEFMVESDGKKHQVPPNYASKSMLVTGDTIKMVVDPNGGQTKYKQIAKVERLKTEGVLVKKDGKYEVLSEEGSFKVLSASIKHYDGEVGDTVKIQYPKNHVKGGWAAVVKVIHANETPAPAVDENSILKPVILDHAQPVQQEPEAAPAPQQAEVASSAATPKAETPKTSKSKAPASEQVSDAKPKAKPARKQTAPKQANVEEVAPASQVPAAASPIAEVEFDDDDLV